MEKKIAILRGINVGGKRKMLMADLRAMCEGLGLKNVESYIQSGNLIFDSNEQNSDLETKLENGIATHFDFEVPVIVRTSKELEQAISVNPFVDDSTQTTDLHFTFLKHSPSNTDLETIAAYDYAPDQFHISNNMVYLLCKNKYHQSKLSNTFFEKKLHTVATTRNWKTVMKLLELSGVE